jgi:hypothetical protein
MDDSYSRVTSNQSLSDHCRDSPRILVDLSLVSRLTLVLFYVTMLSIGYCLMLLVMTFNYPILIVLCLGLFCGHLLTESFGLPKLPNMYQKIAGSGVYLPESDSCCCKLQCDALKAPSEHQGFYRAAEIQTLNDQDSNM